MDTIKIAKQIIEFQKSTFDSAFNAMASLQDQAGTSSKTYFEKVSVVPQESIKAWENFLNMYKKGRDDLKTIVEDGYKAWINAVEETTPKSSKTK